MKLIELIALNKFFHTKSKGKRKAQFTLKIELTALNKFIHSKLKSKRKAQCT